jgi:hypothetical protein
MESSKVLSPTFSNEAIFSQLEKLENLYQNKSYPALIASIKKCIWLTATPLTARLKFYYALAHYFAGSSHFRLAEDFANNDLEYKTKQYQLAIESFKQANLYFSDLSNNSKELKNADNLSYYAHSLLQQGLCEKELGNEEQISYFKSAITTLALAIQTWHEIYHTIPQYAKPSLVQTYLALGQAHIGQAENNNDYLLAENAIYQAQQLLQQTLENEPSLDKIQREQVLMQSHHFYGMCLLKQNKLDQAKTSLGKLQTWAKSINNESLQINAMLGLALCNSIETQFKDKEALKQLNQANLYFKQAEKQNRKILIECLAVIKLWLKDLSLPTSENRPPELLALLNLIQKEKTEDKQENTQKPQNTLII